MKRATKITKLFEEIFGKMAIGYHRTHKENLDSIVNRVTPIRHGDKPTWYGPGVYMTLDLKSQLNNWMLDTYGFYLIKYKFNIDRFVFFNADVVRSVFGREVTVMEQLQRLTKFPINKLYSIIGDKARELERPAYGITESNVHILFGQQRGWSIFKNFIRGIQFKHGYDGNVIVAYDTKSVIPIAFSPSGNVGGSDIKWEPVSNLRAHVRRDIQSLGSGMRGVLNQPMISKEHKDIYPTVVKIENALKTILSPKMYVGIIISFGINGITLTNIDKRPDFVVERIAKVINNMFNGYNPNRISSNAYSIMTPRHRWVSSDKPVSFIFNQHGIRPYSRPISYKSHTGEDEDEDEEYGYDDY